ncbi:AI-2E family transporter [Prochlorococcus sp. MIT 1300]|uniref:AI-2E family transporter n=1 Tax=Prochlorococcus sp. MIT 1300 TaxID=3096218 RepID=UPI002A74789A|nr:AI-2E family transporter [Prochlorococcus sp. MIT 1300]
MRFSQWLALIALLASGLLLWELREVLIHLFAGVVLSMGLCTLTGRIRAKWSIPRPFALTISIGGLLIIISLGLAVVMPPFLEEFQQLLLQLPTAAKELWILAIGAIDQISEIVYGEGYKQSNWSESIFENVLTALPNGPSIASGITDGIKKILGLAGNLGSGLVQLFFVLAVGLMVSIQPNQYREVAILLVPSFYRRRARAILLLCGEALSDWMTGVLLSSLCVALLAGIGLYLLGIKLVFANALLAGILNIIPNFGPVLSTILPMSVALLDTPWKALAVLGLYVFVQNLESYVITPSVMHHQLKLLPGLTLTAQFVFTIIFGPLGLLLALPLAVVFQVLIREVIIHDLLDPWKKKRLA